jgi:protein-tyrosine phosphatase
VLLHCFAGQHRSGAFCAIYRVEFQRWTPAEALDEMRRCGYDNLDAEWDVRNFVLFYQPSWKRPDGLPHPWSQAAPPSKAPAQPDK